MKILRIAHLRIAHLRIALGAVVAAYGLVSLIPIAANGAFKLGLLHPSGAQARLIPLWSATSWFQLGVWAAVVAVFIVVGWRLIRGRAALGLYVLAVLLNTALWWIMQSGDAYQQAFTPGELQTDYDLLLATIAAGVAIWRIERRPGEQATAA